jgi:hypothetical protein
MDLLGGGERGNPGFNRTLLFGGIFAVAVVAVVIALLINLPTAEHEDKQVLEGAVLEGTPAFEEYTKDIIITNDPNRMAQSKTGLGGIVMMLAAKILNKGDKTLTGLEVSVGMIDTKNNLIKDKKVLFVPQYYPELKPGESIDVTVNIDGFKDDDDRANARWKVTAIKFKE